MTENNSQRQQEEIEALEAIYAQDELKILSRESPFALQVQVKAGPGRVLVARFHLPEHYPSTSPPIYEVEPAPWIPESWGEDVASGLLDAWVPDSESLFTGIEWLLVHGPELIDRRSSFVAHLAPVHSVDEIKRVHEHIVSERRVAKATHNIYAYRIQQDNGQILQDQEDDGETAAGGRLLHVMQMLGVVDVLVVVSRWYGGIMLGPDRFKHICNVGRALLDSQGYLKEGKKRVGGEFKVKSY
ncbi:ribosomal protein S5 domain 2-type protein [Piptocephalis cylindrospora]|uniref:Ribosomal protein S5 domain 2-type protein n=1 Tax=Piptocephalis cylindrospora TaxID=1907219 RepID=A0A4V1IYI7_9FUNG|nr:ribosomal protein S5 domain 2-type protein [Piptocephalis cylindrospora]|eukprot:RKP14699.1 ribosomal protein S5 domain 2-type protein [Piptocephalis cylindrospora]